MTHLKMLWTLSIITAQRMLRRKSTIVLTIVGLLPSIQVFLWVVGLHINMTPYGLFLQFLSSYYASLFVPLVAIFLGLGVINDEVETRNITYTLTRPIHPAVVAAGRFLGHYIVAAGVVIVCTIFVYLEGMIFQFGDLFAKIPVLIGACLFLSGGLLACMGVVSCLGTTWRRFAILGSVVWLIFDNVFALIPFDKVNALSIKYRMLASSFDSLPQAIFTLAPIEPGSLMMNMLVFLLIGALAITYMAWYLIQFEIVLSGSDASG
ncbi:MAG: ABC transporter permease [Acidobacteria bacterium]|nr:ABC transporter permease [Acidobacteriota bacterium]